MRDYTDYTFKDFLSDESFINYAKGIKPCDIMLWKDWLAKNPPNRKAAEEAKNFIKHFILRRQSLPIKFIDNEWDRLSNNLVLNNQRNLEAEKSKNKIKIWQYAAAITLFISILGAVFFSDSIFNQRDKIAYHDLIVPRGQIRNILLPDKTLVFLNSDTKLSYNTKFGKKNREVFLEGEAFFNVSHYSDKPFIVHTCENDIKVLGTAFNVRAYPDANIHQTSLERGKIIISYPNEGTYVLNPNQTYLLIRNNKCSKVYTTESIKEFSSWIDGRIIFKNQRFEDIAQKLERSHNIVFDIQNQEVLNCRYTGEFSRNDDLRKIMEIINLTTPFDFEIINDTIIIR